MVKRERRIVACIALPAILILTLAVAVHPASIQKRSADASNEAGTTVCLFDSPCGWEVYEPYSRNHEYYVTSSCICTTGEKCVRTSDDLAVSAYVYNCRVVPNRKSKGRTRNLRVAPTTATTS